MGYLRDGDEYTMEDVPPARTVPLRERVGRVLWNLAVDFQVTRLEEATRTANRVAKETVESPLWLAWVPHEHTRDAPQALRGPYWAAYKALKNALAEARFVGPSVGPKPDWIREPIRRAEMALEDLGDIPMS